MNFKSILMTSLFLIFCSLQIFCKNNTDDYKKLEESITNNNIKDIEESLNSIFNKDPFNKDIDKWLKCCNIYFDNKKFYPAIICYYTANNIAKKQKRNKSIGFIETTNKLKSTLTEDEFTSLTSVVSKRRVKVKDSEYFKLFAKQTTVFSGKTMAEFLDISHRFAFPEPQKDAALPKDMEILEKENSSLEDNSDNFDTDYYLPLPGNLDEGDETLDEDKDESLQNVRVDEIPDEDKFVAVEIVPQYDYEEFKNIIKSEYPEKAKKMNIKGKVLVRTLIDKTGKPIKTKIIKSDSDLFNDAVEKITMKTVFSPAIHLGIPVYYWIEIWIKFE